MRKREKFKAWPQDENIMVGNYGTVLSYYKYSFSTRSYEVQDEPFKCKQNMSQNGYMRVSLHRKYGYLYTHRLVAEAWVDDSKTYLTVNHKDENKTNNYYRNLEWLTIKDNYNYSFGNPITVNGIKFPSWKAAVSHFKNVPGMCTKIINRIKKIKAKRK